MKTSNYTTTLRVDQTPEVVFHAINNVRAWWSEEIEGNTKKLHDEFILHYEDIHRCHIKLVEVAPHKKVVWQVIDNYFKFTQDKSEWIGNRISFEISRKDEKTQILFTQHGLVPEYECYDICHRAWNTYIHDSLRRLIVTGKGQPNSKGNPKTADEQKMLAK